MKTNPQINMMWSPALKSCSPALAGGAPDRTGGRWPEDKNSFLQREMILSGGGREYSG